MRELLVPALLLAATMGCNSSPARRDAAPALDRWTEARMDMIRDQIEARGVRDRRVIEALRRVPRHEFVPLEEREDAYVDGPLPIGEGQTISQPYIVALMTELAELGPRDRVLEVGTGSGYQAAVLAEIAGEVFSIEILPSLGRKAAKDLARTGYGQVQLRIGDGYDGWPEAAPFDAILITAAPEEIPQPLLDQLAMGGRLVAPVGEVNQELVRIVRTHDGFRREPGIPVRFVPMTGKARGDRAR